MAKAKTSKTTTKTDKIIALMKRKQGASLEDLTKATGWLPQAGERRPPND